MTILLKFKGYILIALVAFLWGSTSVVVSFVLAQGMGLLDVAFIMTSIGALTLLLCVGKKGLSTIKLDLIAYGLFVIPVFRILYTVSVLINGAGVTASLLYVAPLIVAILAPIIIGEKLALMDLFLAILAVIGAYLSSNPSLKLTSVTGFLVGLSLAVTYAITIIAIKYFYSKGYSMEEIVMQPTIAAIPILAALSIATEVKIIFDVITIMALLWGGIVSIGLALILYVKGMKLVKALEASIIATLEPVSALFLATLILGEHYEPLQLVGIFLILISALVIALKGK